MKKLTSEDIRAHGELYGVGLMESKRAVLRDNCIEAVHDATTLDELKEVLVIMLEDEI